MGRRPQRAAQYRARTYVALLARVASNVRSLRVRRGWTQEEAAHRCGMATRVLQRVEAADVNLTMTTIARLCDGFLVDVARLVRPTR